MKTPPGNVRLT